MRQKPTFELARIIWDYHHLHHTVEKSDIIVLKASHDTRISEYAADLFLQGYGSHLISSGTEDQYAQVEKFVQDVITKGIPKEKITVNYKAKSLKDSVNGVYQIITEKKIRTKKILLIQSPHRERQTYLTYALNWPGNGNEFIISSPKITFYDYPNSEITEESIISRMLEDLQTIKMFSANQSVSEEIPPDVWDAFEQLVQRGYNKSLVNSQY